MTDASACGKPQQVTYGDQPAILASSRRKSTKQMSKWTTTPWRNNTVYQQRKPLLRLDCDLDRLSTVHLV